MSVSASNQHSWIALEDGVRISYNGRVRTLTRYEMLTLPTGWLSVPRIQGEVAGPFSVEEAIRRQELLQEEDRFTTSDIELSLARKKARQILSTDESLKNRVEVLADLIIRVERLERANDDR